MKVLHLFENHQGRDFVCGDIHGCFELLDEKLSEVNFNPRSDRLFSVGDIIDRGPDSEKALDYLQQNWFYCIRGNHEQMMLDWCTEYTSVFRNDAFRFHVHNGGDWVADYLGISIQKLAEEVLLDDPIAEKYPELNRWIDAIDKLPYAIEIKSPRKKIGIIHAEIPERVNWPSLEAELNKPDVLYSILFSRKYIHSRKIKFKIKRYRIKGIDEVYSGHTVVETPQQIGNINYIDTGAYSNQNLTLIELNYS